jgi:hypothetical protein
MKRSKPITLATLLLALATSAGCDSPPPTCSPTDNEYDICSENRVYTCPVATEEQFAAGEMIETDLKADCAAAGQVCSEDILEGPPECSDP